MNYFSIKVNKIEIIKLNKANTDLKKMLSTLKELERRY
jgi:hypothetical protein